MDQIYSIHHLVSLDAANGYLKAIDAPEIDQNPINCAYYHHRQTAFPIEFKEESV
jgi:hypothetical protein